MGFDWAEAYFDERERRLIANCVTYGRNDPAGLPGHNLMMIVSKMVNLLDVCLGRGGTDTAVKRTVRGDLILFLERLSKRLPPGEGQSHNITGNNGTLALHLMMGETFVPVYLQPLDLDRAIDDVLDEIVMLVEEAINLGGTEDG